jgi:hypothetical protein
MSVVGLVAALAATQHGAVSRLQLREAGASKSAIAWAVRVGSLIHAAPEVFVVAGSPRTWRQRLMVAVLDAGPGACVSHRAAAVLLGIARRNMGEYVEITTPRVRSERLDDVIVHKPLDLDHGRDVMVIDGIPCTGPLRTLVDLGVSESWLQVWDAMERAIQAGLVTHRGMEWMLVQVSRQGRHGCGPYRRALDERALKAAAPHEGLLEPRMASVARRFKLPDYEYQHKVFDEDGTFLAQIDFAWPPVKVGVEVDGGEDHGTPKGMNRDYERDHMLENEHGWYIIRFTWHMVVKRPKYVADQILKVLVARGLAV